MPLKKLKVLRHNSGSFTELQLHSTQNYLARSYVARAQSCVSQNVTLLRLLNFGKEPARKADD